MRRRSIGTGITCAGSPTPSRSGIRQLATYHLRASEVGTAAPRSEARGHRRAVVGREVAAMTGAGGTDED